MQSEAPLIDHDGNEYAFEPIQSVVPGDRAFSLTDETWHEVEEVYKTPEGMCYMFVPGDPFPHRLPGDAMVAVLI